VRGGDLSATGNLTQAASNLLTLGRQNFASSVSFANLESNVRSQLLGVADTFSNDSSVDKLIQSAAQQTAALGGGANLKDIKDAVAALQREIVLLRGQLRDAA
jgi:hypothetical protein